MVLLRVEWHNPYLGNSSNPPPPPGLGGGPENDLIVPLECSLCSRPLERKVSGLCD